MALLDAHRPRAQGRGISRPPVRRPAAARRHRRARWPWSPMVLLLDEITSALDPELVAEVLNIVRDLAREGMTMLLATHEMGFAREVASKVCFLYGGVVHEEGPPEQIFGEPPRSARARSSSASSRRGGCSAWRPGKPVFQKPSARHCGRRPVAERDWSLRRAPLADAGFEKSRARAWSWRNRGRRGTATSHD